MFLNSLSRLNISLSREREHFLSSQSNSVPERTEKTSVLIKSGRKSCQLHKKYFINIWAILFLITIFLNFYLLQPISWNNFKSIFQKNYSTSALFISVLIFGIIFFWINDVLLAKKTFTGRIRTSPRKYKNISSWEWLKLHSITFFIRSITPFSIGSEPYVIWWLKKQGVPLRQGSAIVSSLTISWFMAQGVITWPSFIYLHIQNNWTEDSSELKYYWMVVIGLIVDAISSCFVFTVSYCKRIHYLLALLKYKFNKFFHLPILLTISELRHKYLENKSFKKEFKRTFFDLTTFKTIFVFTIQNILNYSLFALLAISVKGSSDFLNHFNIINISTTSNNFVPTPGSEGSIQFTIEKMHSLTKSKLESSSPGNGVQTTREVIFLWRWFQKYQPLILSSTFLSGYFLSRLIREKIKRVYLEKGISPITASLYSLDNLLNVRV